MRIYRGLDVWSTFDGQFPWRSHVIDVGGGMHQAYIDEGPRDAPLTFILLHGNPTWSFLYRRFIARLSTTYRVIAIDHVGFGRSDKPRDPAYYTLDRHVANLSIVLDRIQPRRVVLVLHDWGGPIGMGWATRHAEHIAGVVVLNTFAFVQDPPIKLPWLFKLMVLGKGGWKRCTKNNVFVEMFLAKGGRKLTENELDAYRAPFPTPDDRIGVARFPQLIPETAKRRHESWRSLANIEEALPVLRDKPALMCWAGKDRGFKRDVLERWRRVFAHVDGPHVLDTAGHFVQEDDPETLLELMEPWAAAVKPR